ncbi:hypothetical protein BS78_01G481200 [Paspalum vaginatum]|nr:hypothetical protein BS78_01G481200 [Paspalum vaginatum]
MKRNKKIAPAGNRTRVCTVAGDIILDVEGYTATKRMCKGGEYFQLHKFSVGGYEWAVRYYPDQGGAGVYVAVTLVLLGKLNNKDAGQQQDDDVEVRFACTLLDRHGQWSTERSRSASYVFSGYGQEEGFWTFATHHVLDDPDSFVEGDCFTLLCVVFVLRKPIMRRG